MANPQRENGTTDIANEILEGLMRTRVPGEARQIIDTIFRQTYGWHKKEDRISLSQFCGFTGLKKPTVIRAIQKAQNMNIIIIKKDNANNSIYLINKDFSTWKPLSKKITLKNGLSKKIIGVDQKDNASLSKKIPTKQTITKQTITKQTITKQIYSSNFEKFWKDYPRKVNKAKALKAWNKLSADEQSKSAEALPNHCQAWKGKELEFIPHLASWLNGRRWEDVLPAKKTFTPKTAEIPVTQLPEVDPATLVSAETIKRLRAARGLVKP